MSYRLTDDGLYSVDWEVVARLVESYARARLQLDQSRVVSIRQSKWYNPFSWQMPDIHQVEVDWDRVGDMVRVKSFMQTNSMYSRGAAGGRAMQDVAYQLRQMARETPLLRRQFLEKLHGAQRRTMEAINSSVESYQGTIEALKEVRDTSATTVLVGASAVTGGAAAAGLTLVGGTLKGVAKYQDTDNVGAAVMEGAGAVVFTLVPMGSGGAELTAGEQAWLMVAQGTWDADTSLVEGKSVGEALADGSLSIVGSAAAAGVGNLLKGEQARKLLDRVSTPLKAHIKNADVGKLMEESIKKGTESAVRAAPGMVRSALGRRSAPPARTRAPSRYVGHAILPGETLLDLAVVNMRRGVGHGW